MITIRSAGPHDAEGISCVATSVQALHVKRLPDVFQPASSASLPATDVAALIAAPNQHFWVALEGDRMVGYLYAEVQMRPATSIKLATSRLYVHQMGVLGADRGHGTGTGLLRSAREFACARGLAHLVLDVWAFNEPACAFYQAQGFSIMRHELWSATETGASPHRDLAV